MSGNFGVGRPPHPYHTTGELAADTLVRRGFDPGYSGTYGDGVTEVRSIFDEERPAGWPPHSGSFFMWPSSSDKWRWGDEAVVLVDPGVLRRRCVVADLATLEWAINEAYDEDERRGLASRYWREASIGSLAEADRAASRYEEAEIFCAPPVPARALSLWE